MEDKAIEVTSTEQMAKMISVLLGELKSNQELIVEIEVKQIGEDTK